MGQDEFERIQPASLDISPPLSSNTPQPRVAAQPRGTFLLLLALCLVAAAVIFVLPRFVAAPAAPLGQSPDPASTTTPATTAKGAASPWESAQAERERSAAKAVLETLLALQFELEERGVQRWAGEEFDAALTLARSGDEAYRADQYQQAEQQYRAAQQQLQQISDGIAERLQRLLAQGETALGDGNTESATVAFETALAIDEHNEQARNGLASAANIEPLRVLMSKAESAEAQGNFDTAATIYREALTLQANYVPARQALDKLQARRNADQYQGRLSAGFAALAAGQLGRARDEFQAALKISPSGSEAREGLQQAQFQLSQRHLADVLGRADRAVAAEQWQGALDGFNAALVIDSTLAPAREGKQQAETRLALDAALLRIEREPERLSSSSAQSAADKLIANAAAIRPQGPRLQAQIAAARKTLALMRTSVPVPLVSDGKTDVTVFRVGNLGLFSETRLELLPGKYIAVGQREGYRDVRVEFAVQAGTTPAAISVRCVQKI